MDEQTKKILDKTFILSAILVVGVLVFFVGEMLIQQKSLDQQNTYQITVSGEGKIYAKPDVAITSLGVTTTAATVADVTKTNTDKMNAVIDTLKALKIDEKDIQTTNYNLSPVYENYTVPVAPVPMMYPTASGTVIRNGTTVTGYKLEQDVQVKIRDFVKVGDVISQATAKGANVVDSLQFTIDNPEQFKDQARAKAIEQAKTNAQNLAKESGVKLGKIINVYENYTYPMAYSSNAKLGVSGADMAQAPVPSIQPGQQEIDVTINLTYQVR
jgi:uncharacterized protein YggE